MFGGQLALIIEGIVIGFIWFIWTLTIAAGVTIRSIVWKDLTQVGTSITLALLSLLSGPTGRERGVMIETGNRELAGRGKPGVRDGEWEWQWTRGGVTAEAGKEMLIIKQALQAYNQKDIFNRDETGLFWKMIPHWSLSTRILPGRKKEKAWISALFCCNADGSERPPIWFIGRAKNPHTFWAAGTKIQNLNTIWRSNTKAWMTGVIFEEWLRWFDKWMMGEVFFLWVTSLPMNCCGNSWSQ